MRAASTPGMCDRCALRRLRRVRQHRFRREALARSGRLVGLRRFRDEASVGGVWAVLEVTLLMKHPGPACR